MTEESPKNKPWAWIIALLIGSGILLLAWDRFGFGGDAPLAGGHGLVDQAVATPSQWELADEIDPMTDEQIVSAHQQIEADGFLIDTTISCSPVVGTLNYAFTAYQAHDGSPADFVEQYVVASQAVPFHKAEVRADSLDRRTVWYNNPRYSNTFEIRGSDSEEFGLAQGLTIKLLLLQGEPIIQIDHADETVARVISQCSRRTSPVSPQGPTPTEGDSQPQAEVFTITEAVLRTSGLSRSGIGVEHVANFCVGAEIVVKNDTSRDIQLLASIYESDDHTDLGTAAAGEALRYSAQGVVDAVITSPEHPTVRFRYRVTDCR